MIPQRTMRPLFAFALKASSLCHAFAPSSFSSSMTTQSSSAPLTLLHLWSSSSSSNNNNNDMEDFEQARQAFETLDVFDAKSNKSPLTASGKRLKEMELTLLHHLVDSDEPVDPLVDLWVREREDAASQLQAMESNCSPGLVREEAALRDMIATYGTEWVEPSARLALLAFMKGHYNESMELCRTVLNSKPWHFEAGHLLMVIYLKLEDFGQALQVARRYTLPSLNANTDSRRRKKWVDRMTKTAQDQLDQAMLEKAVAVLDKHLDECPVDDPSACWQ